MATQTAHLVSDALQIISDLRGESTVNTDALRIRAVSRAEQDFALRRLWRFFLLENQTTTGSGVNSYTVGSASYPYRPKGIAEVFVGGTTESQRYGIVDFTEFKVISNTNNAAQIAYEWYDAANDLWKVYINPAPSSGSTITYSYFWQPPTRTATTDPIIAPSIRPIALNALAEIYDAEDETQKSLMAKQEAEQIVSELEGIDNQPGVNQTYAFKAIENTTRMRGMGTY